MQRSGWGRSFGLLPYPRQGGIAAVWRPEMPVPTGRGKRGIRHRMVSYPPLDSPSSSLGRDSLRSRVETGETGLGSGRLSAYMQLSCPEFRLRGLPRIPVRGHSVQGVCFLLRKALLRSRVYPWSTRRPCGPLAFRCATEGSRSAKEGKGSQEGTSTHLIRARRGKEDSGLRPKPYLVSCPLLFPPVNTGSLRRQTAAIFMMAGSFHPSHRSSLYLAPS